MKFLIVDDSKAMQRIVTKIIKDIGYNDNKCLYASDGRSALAIYHQEQPDIILSDLHMPEMNGLDLLLALRESNAKAKTGIISIDKNPDLAARALEAGALFFLQKPFTPEQLKNALDPLVAVSANNRPQQQWQPLFPDHETWLRIVSTLGQHQLSAENADYSALDFSCSPFFVGTLLNEQEKTGLTVALDAFAANALAAMVQRTSLDTALNKAAVHALGQETLSALDIFMGILSAMCKIPGTEQWLTVSDQRIISNPQAELKPFLDYNARTDNLVLKRLRCESQQCGLVLFTQPENPGGLVP